MLAGPMRLPRTLLFVFCFFLFGHVDKVLACPYPRRISAASVLFDDGQRKEEKTPRKHQG